MLTFTTTQSHMQRNKNVQERIVYKLSKTAVMKFRPEKVLEDSSSSGLISRIRSLSRIFSRSDRGTGESLRKSKDLQSLKSTVSGEGLKFLFKLDSESFLIGTGKQLDAISVAVVEDYIQSEQLWSMRPKTSFLNLLVDDRRKTIVAVLPGELNIYSYQGRRSKNAPKLEKMLKLVGEVKTMQIAMDSLLTLFFQDSVHAYYLDAANSRQSSRKDYRLASEKNLTLFQLAQCADNVINVFFECPAANDNFFQLWTMPIEVTPGKLEVGEVTKIYEVELKHRPTLRIESIARDSYFMNLGPQILMFRKGYCVDRVKINQRVEGTLLKYFGQRRELVHVSPVQIDFYNVTIDLVTNPPKLSIKSFDSVTQAHLPKFNFLDAVKFEDHKLAFFYQVPSPNVSGEVKYSFALTQKWRFEEKIDSILPKISDYNGKYEGAEFSGLLEEIEVSCDAVGKMGMSRKQAYLRVWRQSKKEQVEQFKLLLDTLDYATVRDEILLKLKKKSMLFNEVHKIQSGCLGMIGQNVFSAKGFSMDELKNYLISHFLIRKLELFKEIRLFEKKAGKLKQVESEINKDKLYINIQEYTNTAKMDLKAYLLEMIYNLVKGKDLSTEIRILIHKFRFAFLYIYQGLLKEIICTAKQNLLMLLQTLPQLLPYQPQPVQDAYENALKQGLWAPVTQEEWEGALILETVTTIYNREIVAELESGLWAKRYWLTNHDMIFMNRTSLSAEWQRTRGEQLFFSLIEQIFETYKDQTKIEELIHFIEQKYYQFPQHLYNNVSIYRKLYLHFQSSNVMQDSFQTFLRNTDQDIFKKIFDHQKFKKGSLLREVKPIYEQLKQSDKFNFGLLKYFSSPLSQVSDIKYLLNRINNQKKEFHDEHMEMYEVLVKGMQLKLKLGSDKDIPISEVLIYIENIPLTENNPVSQQLRILKKINEVGLKFQQMKLNMSVFQMIRNRDSVFISTVAFEIENSGLRSSRNGKEILVKSGQILTQLSGLRLSIYGPFEDNILLFIFLVKLVQTKQLIPFVPQIIEENAGDIRFDGNHLENVVFYCYRQQLMAEPTYSKSQEYLLALVSLLPEDNPLRVFITCEIQLALIFSQGSREIKYPISGPTGLITKHELQGLFDSLPKQPLLTIDVQRVFEFSSSLQRIVGGSVITLRQLHQFHFCALLKKDALHRAIQIIESMITLDPTNIANILYPILIFKHIACEFIEENKALMMSLLASLFRKPHELLNIFQQLMRKSFSNQEQKQFLGETAAQSQLPPDQRIKMDNILFNDDFIQYLKSHPEIAEKLCELFQMQLTHLSHSNDDFAKSVDLIIFHLLLLKEPVLLIRYVQLNRYTLNLKEVRSFFSHLCKYEAFDTIKVIEFGKRLFKVILDLQKKEGELGCLMEEAMSTPLAQTRSVEQLDVSTDNLAKLVKTIDRFKAKLKYKLTSSSAVRRRVSITNVQPVSKFQKIEFFLSDPHKCFQRAEYPFNDSDSETQKRQYLIPERFRQGEDKLIFSFKKYLTWLFARTNQTIEYYLLVANEAEADEAVRQQEEALRLSFRKGPNDRAVKDNAIIIGRAFERVTHSKIFDTKELNAAALSAIPQVASSAISLKDLWAEVAQEVCLGTTMLKDEILASVKIDEDKLSFDSKLIQQFGTTQQIESALPELVRQIYNDRAVEYGTATSLIREIYNAYPKMTPVNIASLQIYSKVEQLQKKLGLNLDSRDLLPYDGLFFKEKDSTVLFNHIKGSVLPNLNENNIHTLSRILALSFKRNEFQQEIINDYFKIIVQEYSQLDSQFDQKMKLEKIAAFAQKMPPNHLKQEVEKIVEALKNPQKQKSIVKTISDILRQRNDSKNADLFEAKWIAPLSSEEAQ